MSASDPLVLFLQDICPARSAMDAIETMDSSLMSAMVKSLETGSLTPMIKEELRLKIQTSRLAAGKEELPDVVFKEPEKHAVNI